MYCTYDICHTVKLHYTFLSTTTQPGPINPCVAHTSSSQLSGTFWFWSTAGGATWGVTGRDIGREATSLPAPELGREIGVLFTVGGGVKEVGCGWTTTEFHPRCELPTARPTAGGCGALSDCEMGARKSASFPRLVRATGTGGMLAERRVFGVRVSMRRRSWTLL